MFDWLTPRVMERRPGDPSTIVLMVDRSTSMVYSVLQEIYDTIPRFQAAYPGLRLFGFHSEVLEVARADQMMSCYPPCHRGSHEKGSNYRNATFHGVCLEQIARLTPAKTIVISDGGCADIERALKAADGMTGAIDAYFCHAIITAYENRPFMQELARRGAGRFVQFEPGVGQLDVEIKESIKRIRRIHLHDGGTEIIDHRPQQQGIGIAPTTVRVRRGGR